MSEEDIRGLEPEALKELISENALRTQSLERAKRDYTRSLNEMLKKIKIESLLAMDVLEGKDSALARKILIETRSTLEQR